MEATSFVQSLLDALADLEEVERVSSRSEGPVVNGRAFLRGGMFLAFYYNQETGTQAFALVKGSRRVWGIDYDSIRGWHLHPVEDPAQHVMIKPQSVSAVIWQLRQVLGAR